jgi:hypothetical protein
MAGSAYEPQGIRFNDAASGRTMLLVTEAGPHEGWLCWRHPDGQWVTLRPASPVETAQIKTAHREAILAGKAPIRCVTPDGRPFNVRLVPRPPSPSSEPREGRGGADTDGEGGHER